MATEGAPAAGLTEALEARFGPVLARVRAALSFAYPGVANHQAADLPNIRAIRWYTQLGLVDRPTSAGPAAAYGPRHLRQIVAIKRLQAEGLARVEVQQRLAGLGDARDRASTGDEQDLGQWRHRLRRVGDEGVDRFVGELIRASAR